MVTNMKSVVKSEVTRKRSKSGIGSSAGDKVFDIAIHFGLFIVILIVLIPLLYVLSASLSAPTAIREGRVWILPAEPTLMAYKAIFRDPSILRGFYNSTFYMIAGTVINLLMTVLAAYPLSRKQFLARNYIMGIFTFTMLFSGGLIPLYLLVMDLGLLNTRWAMLLPTAMSVWNVIITRTFYMTNIPEEIYESTMIDGCSDFKFLISIVLPLSGPIMAVMALFYGIAHWNTFFNALIFLSSEELFPLQLVLRNILVLHQFNAAVIVDFDALMRRLGLMELLRYAVIVVATVPMLCIYPFVQRYFVKGVMIGALKG